MIKEAAIKRGRKIWTGRRHSDCFKAMVSSGTPFGRVPKIIQGFITDDGKFVDRFKAYEIALACGQIKGGGTKILISEDLY